MKCVLRILISNEFDIVLKRISSKKRILDSKRPFPVSVVDRLRQEVAAVRLSTGVLAVRVSVIDLNGNALVPFFTAVSRRRIRMALRDRTWVVEDTYLLRQKRLWTGP